jgi:hypothetical protein
MRVSPFNVIELVVFVCDGHTARRIPVIVRQPTFQSGMVNDSAGIDIFQREKMHHRRRPTGGAR